MSMQYFVLWFYNVTPMICRFFCKSFILTTNVHPSAYFKNDYTYELLIVVNACLKPATVNG